MISSPALLWFGAFVVIWTMSFVVGAMYLGGGREAVRRQVPRLAMLAVGLVVVVLAVPVIGSILGDLGLAVILLAMNGAAVAAWVYRSRRGDDRLVVVRPRDALRVPAFRALVIVWAGALAIAVILLILVARAGY